jgi:hypothetical protein
VRAATRLAVLDVRCLEKAWFPSALAALRFEHGRHGMRMARRSTQRLTSAQQRLVGMRAADT